MDTCGFCGYANVPGTLFCEECGHGLTPDAQGRRHATGNVAAQEAFLPEDREQRARFTTGEVSPAVVDAAETGRAGDAKAGYDEPRAFHGHPAAQPTPVPPGDSHSPAASPATSPATEPVPFVRMVERPAQPTPAATVATVYLISDSGRRVDVPAQDVVIVGREDMRSGIRPDVDLTLDGASAAGVSRRHCRLLRQADGWYVEDLMSTNFTVLNGKALSAHTPARVRDGDDLRLGKLRLKFHEP